MGEPEGSRAHTRLVAAAVGALVAATGIGGGAYMFFINRGPGSASATPAGYYIALPDEPLGAEDGLQILDATTNLPEGTVFELSIGSPDIEGSSGGPVIEAGLIRIRVANNACRESHGVLQSPSITVSVIVAPFDVSGPISGGRARSSPPDDSAKQPQEVRAVLGDAFENLWGDQVKETDRGKMLQAEKSYNLPVETCTHKLVDTEGGGLRQIPLKPPREGDIQLFEWCPTLDGTLQLEGGNPAEAADVALRFDGAILIDDTATYEALADPVVRFPSDWYPAGGQEPGLNRPVVVASFPAADGEAVARSCGEDVAQRTWQVVLSDGDTDVALVSYYLVLREDGWKVWGTLEGHGERTQPYGG